MELFSLISAAREGHAEDARFVEIVNRRCVTTRMRPQYANHVPKPNLTDTADQFFKLGNTSPTRNNIMQVLARSSSQFRHGSPEGAE
jgi:hypothetical protein